MDSYELSGRVGRFWINQELLYDDPAVIMKIMSKMVVLRCECVYSKQRFEYDAFSPLFDKVSDGVLMPWYEVRIEEGEVVAKKADQ